jgi:hypothetical protein
MFGQAAMQNLTPDRGLREIGFSGDFARAIIQTGS